MNKFDQLFAAAQPLITTGHHGVDTPPVENGDRWPVSTVFRLDPADPVAERLDDLTREAAAIAGPGHFQTGQLGSAHLTVRALERYRELVPPDDPALLRYTEALRTAAAQIPPTTFALTGLILTRGTVMVCAHPLDDHADHLQKLYAATLGPDGWLEGNEPRDIWYVNLIHFAGPLPTPTTLIDWVTTRRNLPIGELTVDTTELVRFRHTPGLRPYLRPETLTTVPIGPAVNHRPANPRTGPPPARRR
ncbi:hypothetical protein [Kribbella italica]|uniref:2'-5' RNA ligase superfamily protein n=1 Tax=Kribbella italica TaxID=1540520 RepID=A0A7W9MWL0_9ACTN|nr:hypothetical protein [Kribbella italica]MBB5838412.1 hypothetical protein [Kribbella italica]